MAESATRIPAAAPANLTANSRADFQSLAETLQRLCLQLAEQAPRLSAEQRRAQLAEIDATCHRCHSRFRIPGIANDDD
jgi:cytochrome c556